MGDERRDDEVQDLANRLATLMATGLGTRSRWALRAALDAAETEGIAGVLVMQMSTRVRDYPEISFTVGTVDIISRWGS